MIPGILRSAFPVLRNVRQMEVNIYHSGKLKPEKIKLQASPSSGRGLHPRHLAI